MPPGFGVRSGTLARRDHTRGSPARESQGATGAPSPVGAVDRATGAAALREMVVLLALPGFGPDTERAVIGQTSTNRGCFPGGALCRRIAIQGAPAGTLHQLDVPRPVVLAAIVCVPRPSGIFTFDPPFPGPGAIALDGTFTPRR